ncbi:hypothetical protein McanCB56680_006570 [Microsporum canis]|uniref:MHYT domain-containing protein n=1 Tax=Arthroderma otae (strain ATCC MYA-4605 / CBS 113480) TaxID=554155 RepID=C5FFE5_ARTOC|nr:conserved hypothetical protein [Microsporum canis CBS 113480]EEQ28529.1 conserved hypothetical protein [Microsporum canis CBS 113480]
MAENGIEAQSLTVTQSFHPEYIILSFIVSFVGCATCLELLHRRTARLGLYNWYLLITAAVCMGGIGIWCMHFIGNCAIHLHRGNLQYQISYSSTFTATSFFLPIIVLLFAFYFIGASERAGYRYIIATGTLTGVAVCGMHYVGQLGIANYSCTYQVGNVVGAALIAICASITALGVFFRLRASWTDDWWKRLFCGLILASAVSGMHWTAAVGTIYRVTSTVGAKGQLSSSQAVIICCTLSLSSCFFLICLAIIAGRQRKRLAKRVQQLSLACAFFDASGNVMVAPDGSIPTYKITNHYVERSFADDEFNRVHPAFLWAFRASRNWPHLKQFIQGMNYYIKSDEFMKQYCPGATTTPDTGDNNINFELIFKQLFCIAAQGLSEELRLPLEKLGVLYDDVMLTGTKTSKSRKPHHSDPEATCAPSTIVGKGQCIFMVRQLNKQEAIDLSMGGYRFASPNNISSPLARLMQVDPRDMLDHLNRMKDYATPEKMLDPGVYLVGFSLYPSVWTGFDVLVYGDAPNLLPNVRLPIETVTQSHLDILSRMDGWPLSLCLKWLKANGGYEDPEAQTFCQAVYGAASNLSASVDSPTFGQAKFSSRQIKIPCRSPGHSQATGQCTAFSFYIINGLLTRTTPPHLRLTPLRLFNVQQQVYPGIPDHDVFRDSLREEFSHCLYEDEMKGRKSPPAPPSTARSVSLKNGSMQQPGEDDTNGGAGQSNHWRPTHGGIVIRNQITVDVVQNGDPKPCNEGFEMQSVGATVEAGYVKDENETFVDELCAICRKAAADQDRANS